MHNTSTLYNCPTLLPRFAFGFATLLVIICFSAPVFGQSGTLDLSFGTSGKVITSVDTFGDVGRSIAIQPDHKIVVGGTSRSSYTTSDFALFRYQPDGSLDASFGNGGTVITPIENDSEGEAIALQSDGKIVLGGYSSWYVNLTRYHTDGSLDSTFGTNGKVITDIQGYYSEKCHALQIQPDGKILVGGYAQHNSNDNSYFLLARYTALGALDSSFGTNGFVIGRVGKATGMILQDDGKIILGGTFDWSFALQRFHDDGSIDNNFGTNGSATTSVGTSGKGYDFHLQNDGKILAAGYQSSGSIETELAMARYNSDGTLDNTFGIAGIVTYLVGTSCKANTLTTQADGKILVAGEAKDNSGIPHFMTARFQTNGTPDLTFNGTGSTITPIGNSYSIGYAVAIDSSQKITVAGAAYNDENLDVALARYFTDDAQSVFETERPTKILTASPNPLHARSVVQLPFIIDDAELIIYNSQGQLVRREKVSGSSIAITRNDLPAGFYLFTLTESGRTLGAGKFIVASK